MFCRLCLVDSSNYLPFFIDNVAQTDIANIIAKYLLIELQLDDAVSKYVCTSCCTILQDFHAFCTKIQAKQRTLQQHNIDCIDLKADIVSEELTHATEDITYTEEAIQATEDIKYTPLCEPQIDVAELAAIEKVEVDEATDSLAQVETIKNVENLQSSNNLTRCLRSQRMPRKVEQRENIHKNVSKRGRPTGKAKSKSTIKPMPNVATQAKALKRVNSDAYIAANAQLSCCLCGEALNDFNDLKRHFRAKHQCTGYVKCCNKRYKKRHLYVDHLKKHKNAESFKCTECGKVLMSGACLKNHRMIMHPREDELQYQCTLCPRKFAKKYILTIHLKSHESNETHVCEICKKAFTTIHSLKLHQKTIHLNEYECVMCDICGKNLKTKANFMYHQTTMHNYDDKLKAQCQVCQKWYKNALCLNKHMRLHLPNDMDKEYVCEICKVVKYSRKTLDSHIRYHHPKTFHSCTLCSKQFKRQRTLKEHMATHTGEALYICAYCPQTFKSQANMYKHRRGVHLEEHSLALLDKNKITVDKGNVSIRKAENNLVSICPLEISQH